VQPGPDGTDRRKYAGHAVMMPGTMSSRENVTGWSSWS
jgi:hypothetical protein